MRKTVRFLLPLVIALLACQLNASAQKRASRKELLEQVHAYWNYSLLCLPQAEARKIEAAANQLVPGRRDRNAAPDQRLWRLWFVFDIDEPNDHEITVLMETPTVFTIPGEARVRLHFLDEEGKHLTSTEFPLGWRTVPMLDVRFLPDNSTGSTLIEIPVQRSGTWGGLAREYYAFKGTTVTLVRLETAEGEIVRNIYTGSGASHGPPVPPRSADKWKEALTSEDTVEVLRALNWLSGSHSDTDEEETDARASAVENLADIRHVEALRGREDVLKLVERLTKSPNRWIREAAALVFKPISDDEPH
ncbi:MAG: hypothetical protein JO360_18910 [Acidobacteria bacterium]|nr:hypothetical protein [Acidobacteriota bacterium]